MSNLEEVSGRERGAQSNDSTANGVHARTTWSSGVRGRGRLGDVEGASGNSETGKGAADDWGSRGSSANTLQAGGRNGDVEDGGVKSLGECLHRGQTEVAAGRGVDGTSGVTISTRYTR